MLPTKFIRDTCQLYMQTENRKTLKGLGKALQSSYQTIRRVEVAAWKPGRPYKDTRHSWNRKFKTEDFSIIQKTMQRIRDERTIRNGAFSGYGTGN